MRGHVLLFVPIDIFHLHRPPPGRSDAAAGTGPLHPLLGFNPRQGFPCHPLLEPTVPWNNPRPRLSMACPSAAAASPTTTTARRAIAAASQPGAPAGQPGRAIACIFSRLRPDHRRPGHSPTWTRSAPDRGRGAHLVSRRHGDDLASPARRRYLLREPRGSPRLSFETRFYSRCWEISSAHLTRGGPLPRRTGGHRHAERFLFVAFASRIAHDRREADRHPWTGCEPAACRGHHRRTAAAGAPGQGHAGIPRGVLPWPRSPTCACWSSMPMRRAGRTADLYDDE